MSLTVREHDGDWRSLRPIWDGIVSAQAGGILGLDVTATPEWAETLAKVLLNGRKTRTLVLEQSGEPVGILPLYESQESKYRLKFQKLAPITELYAGRTGFMFKEPRVDYLEAFVDYLYERLHRWSLFQVTLVDDSESDQLLRSVCESIKISRDKLSSQASPYIVLENNWQDYFNSRPKKFRWNLRNGRKKMETCGHLRYSICEKPSQLESFLSAMLEIERGSWKETTGTSVTTNDYQESFYKQFCAPALDRGWFYGHLLELDAEPVAYVYGTVHQGVFYDFKESYKDKFKELSPGHVLKTFVFEELYRKNIRLYDFMGACEEYKLRWTDKTYRRSTYVIYNNDARGLALRMGGSVASFTTGLKNKTTEGKESHL
jgi:CelD/BcsL family acetyltransferase involved in cellulose biosynthesis